MDLDRRTQLYRSLAMRDRKLRNTIDDMGLFNLMREDILAEAERIRRIPTPEKLAHPKKKHNTSAQLTCSELLALEDVEFVEAAYQKILLRDPDLKEAYTNLVQLRSGEMTKDRVLFMLSTSDEGRRCGVDIDGVYLADPQPEWFMPFDGRVFIETVFFWLLGRKADEEPVRLFENALNEGDSKRAIYDAIFWSKERRELIGAAQSRDAARSRTVSHRDLMRYDDAEFIANAYRRIVQREADPEGASGWLFALRRGVITKEDVVFELRISDEGVARNVYIDDAIYFGPNLHKLTQLKGTGFIRGVYMWVLGRPADDAGMRHFKELMRKGHSKQTILDLILGSEEAVARRREYESARAGVHEAAGAQSDEERYNRLASRMAEYSIREVVNERQTEDALQAEKEVRADNIRSLYRYTAINTAKQAAVERQLLDCAEEITALHQQLAQARQQFQTEFTRFRQQMQEELDALREESQNPSRQSHEAGSATDGSEQTAAGRAEGVCSENHHHA